MQWLLVFFGSILQKIFGYFIKRYVHKTAVYLAWITFATSLFVAFLAFVKISIAGLTVFAPYGFGFALGFLPPVTWDYASLYMTILTAKRVYDWKQKLGKSYYQTKAMAY